MAPDGLKYIHLLIKVYYSCIFVYNYYIQTRHFLIMYTLKLTEAELETIAAAMEDYKHYDLDEDRETTEELFGGISVIERCNSINNKIVDAYKR